MSQSSEDDEAIKSTNDDAALCKRSAVQLGYWKDSFLQYFIKATDRKAPEINRGYYARVQAMKYLVDKTIELTRGKCQVVNLGAGYDTLYWRLKDEGKTIVNFVDVDFPSVTSRKCYLIKRMKPLLDAIVTEDGEVKLSASDLHAPSYHIVGCDLRVLDDVHRKLKDSELDFGLPTIFLAECVLVYMETRHSHDLLDWIASNFKTAIFISYEQVNMDDRFGQVMIENLKKRGCTLHGILACKSLETQKQRFLQSGWNEAESWDMIEIYSRLPQRDIQRIEKIEFLDEREMIEQLFQHYCVTVGYQDAQKIGLSDVKF